MSNTLSIAAVTATLRKLIEDGIRQEVGIDNPQATTQPPDKVDRTKNLVNLFLYHTSLNAAWRNTDMPRQVKPNETGLPPLALNLYYLLTAYARNDDSPNPDSHRLLGRAMGVLHDHPLLSPADIRGALPPGDVQKHDLFDQVERVRVTPQPLTLEELSKLWAIFQTSYRISAAYEVSVVLIESKRASVTPLPVLRRGENDEGVESQTDLGSPFPTLTALAFDNPRQPSFQLGQTIRLRGHNLDGDSLRLRFDNPRLAAPVEIGPLPGVTTTESTELSVHIADDMPNRSRFVAGPYTVSLVVTRNADPVNQTRVTNELSFSFAPTLLARAPDTRAAAAGDFTLAVTFAPQVRPEQRVSLLFGGTEFVAPARTAAAGTLGFLISPVDAARRGVHYLRLRVDGVDSMLIDYDATPLRFRDEHQVTLT